MVEIAYILQKKVKETWENIGIYSTYANASGAFQPKDGNFRITSIELDKWGNIA